MAKSTLTEAQKKARAEEKAKKFKELGTKRLNKAVAAINLLLALSNKSQYAYTDEQVETINKELKKACDNVATAFKGEKVTSGAIEL